MILMYRGLEPHPSKILGNLRYLAVFLLDSAAVLPTSIWDKRPIAKSFKRVDCNWPRPWIVCGYQTRVSVFPFFLFVGRLQVLAILLSGLVALAALWAILRFAGILNKSDLEMLFRVSAPTPLIKVGLSAITISFVLLKLQ